MNADNFADFLNDKSNLYKLTYQELKTLTLQYPYSSNLQLLLTLKSRMEQHKDFEKNLARAATLCPDRTHLLQLIKSVELNAVPSENLLLKDDYLELKDLSQLQELDKVPATREAVEQNGTREAEDTLKVQLQQGTDRDEEQRDNPFLNSSGKDYEDINLSETLLRDLLNERQRDADAKRLEDHTTEPVEPAPEPEAKPDEVPPAELEAKPDATPPEERSNENQEEPVNPPPEQPAPEPVLQVKPEPQPEVTPHPATYEVPGETILNLAAASKIMEITFQSPSVEPAEQQQVPPETDKVPKKSRPKPSPKSSFTSWVQQFQPEHTKLRLAELMEAKKLEELKKQKKLKAKKKKKKKKQKEEKNKARAIAEQSIVENTEIATETLAELLTRQGRFEKAIQVYQRLSVMYPEKSASFGERIAYLEGLLNA